MTFGRVFGVVADIRSETVTRALNQRGELVRSARGEMADGRRSAVRVFRLKTAALPHEQARALSLLCAGFAHVFSFDGSMHAGTSLAPLEHGAHLAPGAGWSGDALVVRSGETWTVDPQLLEEWAIFFRFRDAKRTGSPWATGVITHDGREMLDGVHGVVGLAELVTVYDTGVVLHGVDRDGNDADTTFDELAIFLFRPTDDQLAEIAAWEQPMAPVGAQVHLVGDVVESPLGIYCTAAPDKAAIMTRGSGRSMRGLLAAGNPLAPYAIDSEVLNNALAPDIELTEARRPGSLDVLPLPVTYAPLSEAAATGVAQNELISGAQFTPATAPEYVTGPAGEVDGAFIATTNTASGSSTVPDSTEDELSVGGWFRPNAIGSLRTIFSKWRESLSGREWRVRVGTTGKVQVEVSNGAGTASELYESVDALLAAGIFSWLSFDYDVTRAAAARVRLFVDGSPRSLVCTPTGAFAGMTVNTATLYAAGQHNPATAPDGHVAHFVAWQRALKTEEHRIAYLLTKRGHWLRRT